MNDLDQDRNAQLAAFSNKLKEKAAAQGVIQAPTENNTPVPTPAAPPAPAAVVSTLNPTETSKPATEPVAQPATPPAPVDPAKELSTEPAPVVEEVVEPWDKELTEVTKDEKPLTLEGLSSALKLEGIKSTDDLVAKFTGLETELKTVKATNAQVLDNLPEDLREVVKVAQSSGDWRKVLGTRIIDYTKVDPVALFEQEFEQSPQFKKPDGTVDTAAVDEALATIPTALREMQGNMLKQQLANQQTARRNQLFQEATRKQQEYNTKLADASKRIAEILPKDKVGITLEPKHSDFLYEGIRSGRLVEKHLGNIDVSGIAPERLLRTIALAEFGERISQHQYSQGVVFGKKQLLTQAQNPQLRTPSIPPDPARPDAKPVTAAERMRTRMETFSKPGSL
jgi:hypothetical protein